MRANARSYLWLNVGVYSLLALGALIGVLAPGLHESQTTSFENGPLSALVGSVLGNLWLLALVIFVTNTLVAGLATIVLPSLAIPFGGLALLAFASVKTGVVLAPVGDGTAAALVPHVLTLVIEFQGYILLALGGFVLGRAWLRPTIEGVATRRQAYAKALRRVAVLVVPALILLVIGAVYEAFELLYIVPNI